MIYEKNLSVKKQKIKRIFLDDFGGSVSSQNSEKLKYNLPTRLYNFATKNGKLEQGYGLKALTIPTSESDEGATLLPKYTYNSCGYQGVWLYRYYNEVKEKDDFLMLLYGDNGAMYFVRLFDNDSNVYSLYDMVLTSKPTIMNYRMHERNYIIIFSKTDGMIAWDGVTIPQKIVSAPNIRSACLHGARLFALVADDNYAIRYSSELDPTNWLVSSNADSSGIIRFSDQLGKANKIVSFCGYIYVFREYGISKIAFYEDDNTYNISHIFFSGSRIYQDSIAMAEKEIYFMTRDGVYTFDGVSFEKQNLGLDNLLKEDNRESAFGVFFRGKYHLACKLKFDDNSYFCDEADGDTCVNNSIIVFDPKAKNFELIRGVDACCMLPLEIGKISKLAITTRGKNKNYVSQLDESGVYYSNPLLKVWSAGEYSFGDINNVKLLRSFCIKTKYNITIKIKTDIEERSFDLQGSNSPQTIKVNLKGKLISFDIFSYVEKADISALSMEVVCDE